MTGETVCMGTGAIRSEAARARAALEAVSDPRWSLTDQVVRRFGGRYSLDVGIDLDAGDAEVERWFVAATLFGARISAQIAERAFDQLAHAGIERIVDAGARDWDALVALLDAGGYARYDFRTATRLQSLARVVAAQYDGDIGEIGRRFTEPAALVTALEDLPGWGPVTVGLFLRRASRRMARRRVAA